MPSGEASSGPSSWMRKSPTSSLGRNDRPTIRFSGKVSANTRTEVRPIATGWLSDHSSDEWYQRSIARKKALSFVLLSFSASAILRNRELSIGVSVKLTNIDTRIENAIVQPNG